MIASSFQDLSFTRPAWIAHLQMSLASLYCSYTGNCCHTMPNVTKHNAPHYSKLLSAIFVPHWPHYSRTAHTLTQTAQYRSTQHHFSTLIHIGLYRPTVLIRLQTVPHPSLLLYTAPSCRLTHSVTAAAQCRICTIPLADTHCLALLCSDVQSQGCYTPPHYAKKTPLCPTQQASKAHTAHAPPHSPTRAHAASHWPRYS